MKSKRSLVLSLFLILAIPLGLMRVQASETVERLGENLFFDANLSNPPGQSCAACHEPGTGFTGPDSSINAAGAVVSGVIHTRFGNRKPPTAIYAGNSPVLHYDEAKGSWIGGMFWDGRATGQILGDPLAEQAQAPFLNPLEQNNPNQRLVCIKVRNSDYADIFEEVWGPNSLDWTKDVNSTYEKIARSIAAYERSDEVNLFSSKYDYYLRGQAQLTPMEAMGLMVFEGKGKCSVCHPSKRGVNGEMPLFTDFSYHNLGIPKNPQNPFYSMPPGWNPDGTDWIDYGLGGFLKNTGYPPAVYEPELGKFKTPTLRNVDKKPYPDFVKAYGHNGVFKSLMDILHFYNTRDVPGAGWPGIPGSKWPEPEVPMNINTTDMGNLKLTPPEGMAIIAFLKTLTDGYILPSASPPARLMAHDNYANTETPNFQLFQNLPNPFNPETWIPFSLGTTEEVVITIHDVQGRVVKILDLGTREAGIYKEKDKAAYWDGTNSDGEKVSSGVYYYVMQAGKFTQARKMVILE